MAATEGIRQHQSTWSPYDNNGGTCIAIAGANYCVIAADTRMSTGYSILSRDYSKICNLSDKVVMASSGFQADVKALQKNLSARHLIYQHQHNKQMSCPAMAQLLSNTLYYKRFFPYYSFNILGGLDNEGKGCVFTYDAVGSYEQVGYAAQGTGGTLMMPVLDNQLKSPSPLLLPAQSFKPLPISLVRGIETHGAMWDDGAYSGIRQIIVAYGHAIHSISIEYDNDGSPFWWKHGESGGDNIEKIELDYPKEILTSISGHYDYDHIRSLTFESNLKKYGPFGRQEGSQNHFSLAMRGMKIVGFYGRSWAYLDFIGVHFTNLHAAVPPKSLKPISVGPWGGKGGDKWNDGAFSGIRQIIVAHDGAAGGISSISIEYDNNGSPFWRKHGKSGGDNIKKIELDYPKEILTSVSVDYDNAFIRALTFESNLNKYGPYGSPKGMHILRRTDFSFPISNGKIVGFHGSSDEYLRCVGVNLSNLHMAVPPKSLKPISVGPWGGKGGDMWDDGAFSGIRQIIVAYDGGAFAVSSISIEYDDNGSPCWSKHGGSGGDNIKKIELDYPKEILTSISGFYDDTYLKSLTFKSNLNTYIVDDLQRRINFRLTLSSFSFPITNGKIVGFHGRSDEYLRCIGVNLSNLHTAVPPKDATTPLLESEAVDLVKDVFASTAERDIYTDATTPILESEAVDLVKDVFASAAERDIYTGDGLEIVVVNAEGVKREFLELRRD